METLEQNKKRVFQLLVIFLVILSLFFALKILAGLRSYMEMGSSNANTITLSGHGEIQAVPDIANVYFTIRKVGKTIKEAQDGVAEIEKKALDFLRGKGVLDKDIKTENVSVFPKYQAEQKVCPQYRIGEALTPGYCPTGRDIIVGYTASESITVKIRNIDDSGAIVQGLGGTGVSDLNGPNFGIDNEDSLKAEARKKAINDARIKAQVLAKDLGVRLGRIASFSESSIGGPIYYGKAMMDSSVASPSVAEIPKGENTISSDVTITYEIR